jgi:hypothetical protein
VGVTLPQGAWSGRLLDMGFIGRLLPVTQRRSWDPAGDASTSLGRFTPLPKGSRQSSSPGPSSCGVWTF